MFRKPGYSILAVLCLAALLAGCSLPGSGGAGSGTPSGSPSGGGAAASGPCANPLLPVVAGAAWNYQMTGAFPDTFTRTINSVSESGFEDQDVFGTGVTRTGEWNCDAGALIALDPGGGTSASVEATNNVSDFHTTALSGVTLPASVAAGDSWAQSISIAGTTVINGTSADSTSDTTAACTASGMESVDVPAGSFNAMKITCQATINITVTTQGITVPVPALSFTTDSWYAPGVGWVKSVSSGSGVDATITLTSYALP
jgi:hypothetical protein